MPRGWFPLAAELQGYGHRQLHGDLSAGLTVGVMLIPQGMAYALIAGVPPIYGLYASLAPVIVYALLGTSRPLAVGPVALVSLLVAAAVAPRIDLPRSSRIHGLLAPLVRQLDTVHLPTLLVGVGGIVLLAGLRHWRPAFPASVVPVLRRGAVFRRCKGPGGGPPPSRWPRPAYRR